MKTLERGFTLIELLVAVAIAGIIAAFALPNFANQIAAGHAQTLMNLLASDVQWARGKAAATGQTVTLSFNNPACTWQTTVSGTVDTAHSMTPAQLSSGSYSQVFCNSAPLNLTFNPGGSVTGVSNAALKFSAGGQTYSMLLLASGSIVLNPSQAS
ncbi:MAG: hypothetical protein B7X31_14510 [Thiomonas sp. 13-66-29]|jgi:type IV fimbrial biogenesis protein FimT|nr:MAG: hypothetical protein B7X46_11950 [Thiomonas sp. 15-66-11]OZB57806.1 MAG: hypothetical protein B7X31_14510 [Thiomonas sp. 13-66-29]